MKRNGKTIALTSFALLVVLAVWQANAEDERTH